MKDVTRFNPACEIKDWPVVATGRDGKIPVFLDLRKVLLSAGTKVRQQHYFPSKEAPFAAQTHPPSTELMKSPG